MVADIVVRVAVKSRTLGKCAVGQEHELLTGLSYDAIYTARRAVLSANSCYDTSSSGSCLLPSRV